MGTALPIRNRASRRGLALITVLLMTAVMMILVGALLTGYHLFVYDLCLLLLAAAVVCADLAERKSLLKEKALTGVLLLLYMPPLHNSLINHQVYALMCVPMTALLVVIGRIVSRANSQHSLAANFAPDDELNGERLCA